MQKLKKTIKKLFACTKGVLTATTDKFINITIFASALVVLIPIAVVAFGNLSDIDVPLLVLFSAGSVMALLLGAFAVKGVLAMLSGGPGRR